jgi:protein transport protein SEC61 subunit gamma-like protein
MKEGQNGAENKIQRLKDKLDLDDMVDDLGISAPSMDVNEYVRVLKLARKPSREEFTNIAKVSMAGIALIGLIGFLIYAVLTAIPKSM